MLALAVTGCASAIPTNITSGLANAPTTSISVTPIPTATHSARCTNVGCPGGVEPDKISYWLYTDLYEVQFISLDIISNNVSGTYIVNRATAMTVTRYSYTLAGSINGDVLNVEFSCGACTETMMGLFTNGSLIIGNDRFMPTTYNDYILSVKSLCMTWNVSC